MQPLALVVLGISGLPQPVPLASARTTLVKIVPSQGNLLTGYSRCNMAYPAKHTFRRKQKLLRRFFFFFFSCIAEGARDMVGQLLGIRERSETGIKCMSFHQHDRPKQTKPTNNTTPRPVKTRKKGETTRAPLSPS